ncbi:MAG: Phosphoribosylglycinamide formyltransferase [Planctomycetota bacterium]
MSDRQSHAADLPTRAAGTPMSVAVLISGGGTTLRNLLTRIAAGELPIAIRLVISSNPSAKGMTFANEAGIPVQVFQRKAFADDAAYGEAIFAACREAQVELVVMGGFLKFVPVPPDFTNRVVNIHPSLIPAFCGHGFYGHHVHEAVLEYGAKVSGCTVHFVDNHYDHGPIILQRTVPVLSNDTPDTLAARVFQQECEALPDALRKLATGRVRIEGRRVIVSD